MKKKSIKLNAIYNIFKQVSAILMPMIVYPYVTRVLGAQHLGDIEYAKSIARYFVLFAGLGISDYAVREGARIRDDRKLFNKFATEIIVINSFTAIVSFLFCYFFSALNDFSDYRFLIIVFSLEIPFSVIGMNWIFGIFEEYKYISVRSVLFQIISATLVFLLVSSSEDYLIYAMILMFSVVGSNLINIIQGRKYFCLNFSKLEIKKHIKPIIVIFGMTLASSIYTTMDVTMLGFMDGTESVGYYSAANKLIIVIGTLIAAIRTVLIPRLSYVVSKGEKEKFKKINGIVLKLLVFFSIPMVFGIFILNKEIIILFCGQRFLEATTSLFILAPEIVLSAINGFVVYQIFIPQKRERDALICIVCGAVSNLIINAFLIPQFHQNGAALATILSELVVLLFLVFTGNTTIKNSIDTKEIAGDTIKSIIASIIMFFICFCTKQFFNNIIVSLLMTIFIGMMIYFIIQSVFNNSLVKIAIDYIKNKHYLNKE